MQLNFLSGKITRVTDMFQSWGAMEIRENELMKQLIKEPGTRD